MSEDRYYAPEIETMERGDLDALIDERVRYTVQYAAEHSPFYRIWFSDNTINPGEIKEHEDLLNLPVISGKTIREHQPPPYYPQANGKLERFYKTIKVDAIRPAAPQTREGGLRVIGKYVEHYNGVRLHSAVGYVTPNDVLAGRQQAIWATRDEKLARARELRAQRRAEKAAP